MANTLIYVLLISPLFQDYLTFDTFPSEINLRCNAADISIAIMISFRTIAELLFTPSKER